MSLRSVSFYFLVIAILALTGCASGSAIVTGNVRPVVSPHEVKLYLESPPTFAVTGLVNASSDAGMTEQGSMGYAVEELKRQAAKLGANGVLLIASGEKTSGYVTGNTYAIPVVAKTVQGKAIFVDPQ